MKPGSVKKIIFVLLYIVGISYSGFAQTSTLQQYYTQAMDAYDKKNYPLFYEMIVEAHKLHPYHQGIMYQVSLAAALHGKEDESIQYLKKAIHVNSNYDLQHEAFISLKDKPAFQEIVALQQDLKKVYVSSDTAFVVTDRQLHLECIAPAGQGNFYAGSIHKRKVIRIRENGEISDFISPGDNGMASVVGLASDLKRNTLWVASSPLAQMDSFEVLSVQSAVFKYNLKTGAIEGKYALPKGYEASGFGDITVGQDGRVFVSDSKTNTIFTVNTGTRELALFYHSSEFWGIQGLALSDDGKHLFIADYIKGIFRLEISNKELLFLPAQFDLSLKSIDGLYYYDNSLIAIQNQISPMRVTRYMLDPQHEKMVSYRLIDKGHPSFNEPTTGCMLGATLYYVSNSQWSGYDNTKKIKPEQDLQDIVILKKTF